MAQSAASEAATLGPRPGFIARRYFRLASGFWTGPTRRNAWLLTMGVLAFVVANLAAALGVNRWNRFFFDMLEQKNTSGVMIGIGLAAGLVLGSAVAFVGLVQMRMRLQLRWRQWLTAKLIADWLSERRFYQLNIVTGGNDNPEYRIADDVRMAVEPLVEFIVGLANAVLAAVAFLGVLWAVGGALRLGSVTVPGYMVFGAVLY
jgi:putative ATP-binding cassette transporter